MRGWVKRMDQEEGGRQGRRATGEDGERMGGCERGPRGTPDVETVGC